MATVRSGQSPDPDDGFLYAAVVPDDLMAPLGLGKDTTLSLTKLEWERLDAATAELEVDPHFEHLRAQELKDALWRFVCLCNFDRSTNHVEWFVRTYGREPSQSTCCFPIEHLVVRERVEINGVVLMPTNDPEVPPGWSFAESPNVGGVIAIPVSGTTIARMRDRARARGDHVLRLLRVGLRDHPAISDSQIRFRLADVYVIKRVGSGWTRSEDKASELGLDLELQRLFEGQPLSALPAEPSTDIERRALIALRWLDRARLATDDITRALYNFFALEALLGDISEGKKGLGLTFRRSMLALATEGGFSSPSRLFDLYDKVRSYAVHGEDPPDVPAGAYSSFDWDARRALNQFLAFASQHELKSRPEVISALQSDPRATTLLDRLREVDPQWKKFSLPETGARRPG